MLLLLLTASERTDVPMGRMPSTLLVVSVAVSMLLGASQGCFLDDPQVLTQCITFDVGLFLSISRNELGPVCQRAKVYFDCAAEFAKDCPAANTLQGVLRDLGVLILDCCNTTSGPTVRCPTGKPQVTCFPSGASVRLASGQKSRMEQLEIGSIVKAVSSDGRVVDSEVIMFMDSSEEVIGEYIKLSLQSGHELHASPLHLVAVQLNHTAVYKHASTIRVGDVMLVDGDPKRVTPSPVVAITKQLLRGAFAPMTMEGTLLVDDVFASCYAMVQEHWMGHMAFIPMRALHRVSKSVLGVSAWHRQQQGLHWMASILWKFAAATMPSLLVA